VSDEYDLQDPGTFHGLANSIVDLKRSKIQRERNRDTHSADSLTV
jgi:hypothetical protein